MKNFLEELQWRGMLHSKIEGIEEKLNAGKIAGYIGFDPTAPSLTIGNYVQVMLLKLFQLSGHQPIVLMGGATGRIGDPSGKDKERDLKTTDELDNNLSHQIEQFKKMKRSAILINTARGGLVDEHALKTALETGLIAGAGFDVLTKEPPKEGNPLLEVRTPNFILTPHVAWASDGAMQFLADQLIDNVEASIAGTPQNLVT
jgi:hypothetical protein